MENEENEAEQFDLSPILSSEGRDYLIRNNGDRVEVSSLEGKITGLYFSASWCGPCQRLVEVYEELTQDKNFEIVFASLDADEASFDAYFSKMPWLAIPFSETREKLDELFSVGWIPCLVILDENGRVVTRDAVENVRRYGSDAFPFTPEHISELEEQEEEAKRMQSLQSLLTSKSRDYVITSDGHKVSVSELEGKIVGLYFTLTSYGGCEDFDPKLIEVYKGLKQKGENFEIVMIPLDDEDESFQEHFEKLSWLSLPVKDKTCAKLMTYFELGVLPAVVVIGPDGKTLHSNVVEAIEDHGINAYPFTPEKFSELEEIEKAKRESQTLESILVSKNSDFVIGKDDIKVPISDLAGKTILLYFSAHWCPPCRAFLPALMKAYEEIKEKGDEIEVIFISSDTDQESFDEFFSKMPWLAIPFGDERKESLSRVFKVRGIPMVIAIGPHGKTITTSARELIMSHGAGAYPFTAERLKEIEEEHEKMAEDWPKQLNIDAHEHDLHLSKRQSFYCDGCGDEGSFWSFYCSRCEYDLHPKCAFECVSNARNEEETVEAGEGWVCDGDKCYRE